MPIEFLCAGCLYDHQEISEIIGISELYSTGADGKTIEELAEVMQDKEQKAQTQKIRRDNFRDGCRELRLVKKQMLGEKETEWMIL